MTETQRENDRPAWPLFTVAALSFVPFLGIIFGGAGATWGLVSGRRRALLAALIAMIGALANIGAIMVYSMNGADRGSKDSAGRMTAIRKEISQRDMLRLVFALDAYHAREHSYPEHLEALPGHMGNFRIGLLDQSIGTFRTLKDYQYHVAPDGESYDLFGIGPDNTAETADDVRPVIPDSIKGRTGYRPPSTGEKP